MLAFVSCKSLDKEKKKRERTFIGQKKEHSKNHTKFFPILDLQTYVHLNTLSMEN